MLIHFVLLSVLTLFGILGKVAPAALASTTEPTRSPEESILLSNTRQLIYEGKRSGEGYFSSDGKKIIFQSEREADNPFYQIYTLDLTTGDVELVSTGTGKTTCAYFNWGADNQQILFSSTHLDPLSEKLQQEEFDFRESGITRRYSWDYDPQMDIFSAGADGKNPVRLTDALGYDAEASYSPDGSLIAFSSTRSAFERDLGVDEQRRLEMDPSYFGEIYLMNVDGSDVRRLTQTPGYDGGPFFSPDGQRIIWRRFNESGYTADVFTMTLDGSDVRRLTDFEAMSWAPYYHPTMEYVIFGSNKMGFTNFELYIVDAAGTKEPQRVTFTDGFDSLPVFSPDGTKLLWTSTRTSNRASQLFFADWNHEAAVKLLAEAPARGAGQIRATAAIESDEMQSKVDFLASDKLEGRMTGSTGIQEAADWLVKSLIQLGVEPMNANAVGSSNTPGSIATYRHAFDFVDSIELVPGKNNLSWKKGRRTVESQPGPGYMPLPFSSNGSADAEIIFAGYGLTAPDDLSLTYDDYGSVDVSGKIVMVLDGMPDFLTSEQRRTMLRYSTQRYKSFVAKEKGAVGILFVNERATSWSGPKKERTTQQSGILAADVTVKQAEEWLAVGQKSRGGMATIEEIKASFATLNPHAKTSFEMGVNVALAVELQTRMGRDENIVGVLYARGADGESIANKTILLGAHLDHLGFGEASSRASGEEANAIHNGADDNASGTAMVLELAEYLAGLEAQNPGTLRYNIAFAFWSGEELGLIGSTDFTKSEAFKDLDVAAYLNFDMVGMLKDNQLLLQGLGSSDGWKSLVEKRNVAAGFQLALSDDPYVPTDGMALYQAGVPILCFFTGLHDHYHMPSDDVENLNYGGMKRIADYAAQILLDLNSAAEPLAYKTVEMNAARAGSMRGFSVYLGTIPDYAAQGKGVKLSGVREGGPAEKAGLKAGDVIVKMAGKDLNDLYDYTYALGDLRPGVEIDVVVERGGQTLTLKMTPEAR